MNVTPAGFSGLIERHYPAGIKLASSILRDRADAEDEVQNACTKAFQRIGSFQGNSAFSTWFSRIVVNQCLMRLRRRKRAPAVSIEDLGLEGRPMEFIDRSVSPESALGRREAAAVLAREIRRIPPLLREPLILREIEERSLAEVAERMGLSQAAVKSRLLRARKELWCGSRSALDEWLRSYSSLVSARTLQPGILAGAPLPKPSLRERDYAGTMPLFAARSHLRR